MRELNFLINRPQSQGLLQVCKKLRLFSYPQFVDLIRVGEDFLEVDDILVPQSGQNLHLSQSSLTVGLERRENISLVISINLVYEHKNIN